ncbi:hypothetical protein AB4099_18920 [Bosea sp. 2KB_26]|uniref:hypothetical protein n=1 Tax=Bosea sp. 2KB_26 TaxID=3237475 RepID=UPI003F9363AC
MRNLEYRIPGFLGLVDDMQSRIAAVGEGDIPTEWTPEHVGARLIEAFEILSRSGGRVGPGRFGNGWPAMVQEYADLVDQQARELAQRERQQAMAARPSSDEVSRMNEALRWPMDHLDGMPLASDALMLWAYASATHRDMNGMLHQRKKRATALASEMMRRANEDPHGRGENGAGDCRSIADQWRAALRRQIASDIVEALNAKLASAPKDRHDQLIKAAHADLGARCKAMNCLPYRFKPHDAVPGRVLSRTSLDRQRKIAMAAVAGGLRRAAVAVR